MFEMSLKFFKSIYNEDVVFHYTKASTAIDYILFNNQLKFSAARSSNDPIESSIARRSTMSHRVGVEQSKKTHEEAENLHKQLEDLERGFHQICFCKNVPGDSFASNYYSTQFKGNEELFGFAKPRMWDQYGDKYTGVCIAFSKSKILALNSPKFDLIENDVDYLTYRELYLKKVGDIQIDHLFDVGIDPYRLQIERQVKEAVFCKHKDYSDEREYRIGTLFNKENCIAEQVRNEWIFYKTMMLDITNCIEAIFVSSYANSKQKESLRNYTKLYQKPLIEIKWLNDMFLCVDYEEDKKFWEQFDKEEDKNFN